MSAIFEWKKIGKLGHYRILVVQIPPKHVLFIQRHPYGAGLKFDFLHRYVPHEPKEANVAIKSKFQHFGRTHFFAKR